MFHYQYSLAKNNQTNLIIYFDNKDIEQIPFKRNEYSSNSTYRNAKINFICQEGFMTWLREEIEANENLEVWDKNNFYINWEFLNGTKIKLGNKSLVLVPQLGSNEECEIDAEWIDIPEWTADYYIPIYVDLDNMFLLVQGYTTHKCLKNSKITKYDEILRKYYINTKKMFLNIDNMLIVREYNAENKTKVNSLQPLSESKEKQMITKLGHPTVLSPRYAVKDFSEWCALIDSTDKRKELYEERCFTLRININKWYEGIFEEFWQSLSDIVYPSLRMVTSGSYKLQSNPSVTINNEISKARLVKLGKNSVALEVSTKIDRQNSLDLICKIYSSINSNSIDLPIGLKIIIMDRYKNILKEEIVTNSTGCIQFDLMKIKKDECYVLEINLNKITEKIEFYF
ncbi:protein of unknown function DUF1822 (plasmid) [Stanieria cyanosphaera PCC 7437]|uniref:Uncharacterized protein n=1 Tax=Stanieria cyanosphaera (strain ATCC 29371 / PCC 7437) TaxID=111780 RepID=K9Y174_STAC7|nr:DUF1822 family protein [Stanieria cyanosphaera]AFZ38059.1 protein of unknown function DUF1822 [Stanieria cyanosphaera PCC 7437]